MSQRYYAKCKCRILKIMVIVKKFGRKLTAKVLREAKVPVGKKIPLTVRNHRVR